MKSSVGWLNVIAILWYGLLADEVNVGRWIATLIFSIVIFIFAMITEVDTNKEETDGQ